MRVLVVDDNSDGAETMSDLLNLSGFEASWTASGRTALELLARQTPDALVADYLIPDIKCSALIEHAKKTNPSVLVIVWTGSSTDLPSLRANASVDYVVLKPAGSAEIVDFLRGKRAR